MFEKLWEVRYSSDSLNCIKNNLLNFKLFTYDLADFPAVFFIFVTLIFVMKQTDKYKCKIMKIRVSWVWQSISFTHDQLDLIFVFFVVGVIKLWLSKHIKDIFTLLAAKSFMDWKKCWIGGRWKRGIQWIPFPGGARLAID